jgi:hypothetical protein
MAVKLSVMLGNDSEMSNYTIIVARWRPVEQNNGVLYAVRTMAT